jgi:microcystin degradation protein MlrC
LAEGLAAEYYELVWRAVREGPEVLEALWGEAVEPLRELFHAAKNAGRDSVALRFYVTAGFVASRMLADIASSALELPKACTWLAAPAQAAERLASRLLRDLLQERMLYSSGQALSRAVEHILKALTEAARAVVECCGEGGGSTCLDEIPEADRSSGA